MRCSAILLIGITALAWAAGFQRIQDRQSNWTIGQTVQTSSGPVSGHSASNDSKVSEYLGIPFGQAPIGDLRFAAPVRFNGTAPLDGSDFVGLEAIKYVLEMTLTACDRASHVLRLFLPRPFRTQQTLQPRI